MQPTLAKVFVSWCKIRWRDAVRAYAARTLVNTPLADKRSKRTAEMLTDRLPECPVEPRAPDGGARCTGHAPTQARAVVVLRYWEDLSVERVTAVLGCWPGQCRRAAA